MSSSLFEIPKHWKWVILDDIGIVVSGGTPSTKEPEFWNGDIPWITPADLSDHDEVYISKGNRNISQVGLEYSSAYLLPVNSVVFSSRAPIGYVAITKNELATNQGFKNLILPSELVNPKYVYYYLKTVKELAENMASGTTFLELSATKFRQIPFPLAPIEEQNSIVEKIEELFSELDKSMADLSNTLNLIELQRKNILNRTFKNIDAKIVRLKEVTLKITDGTHHTPKYTNEGIHFISVKDIRNSNVDFSNTRFISEEEHESLIKRCNPEQGDILITKSGTIGRLAIVPKAPKFSLFVSVALIKIDKKKIDSKYLFYCLENFVSTLNIKEDIKGAVQKNFHLEDIREVNIPFIEIEEQIRISEYIEQQMFSLSEFEKDILSSLKTKEKLFYKILQEAFEGKLVNQINASTSTDILLKNIQKEKEQYLLNQQEVIKKRPKIRRMEKEKLSIIQVLEKNKKPISAKHLWEQSMYNDNIEKFYSELKKVQDRIIEEKTGKGSLISLR